MSVKLKEHVSGLLAFLRDPYEKANEDLALQYFRKVFGEGFTRQAEAKHADGYLPGYFVVELKGKTSDWLKGLFQGIAYRRELDFSLVVVAAKQFFAVWDISVLPAEVVDATLNQTTAASSVGVAMASMLQHRIKGLEAILTACKKVRQKVTPKNFTIILKQMTQYFDPDKPTSAVRAFYTMVYGWREDSILEISNRVPTQATLGGETIGSLIPAKRDSFKHFVESHVVSLNEKENLDDFFTLYDKALDAVDKDFRVKNGIFFTDLSLSRFVMWYVKKVLPDLGTNYLVIDPAAGSGNLVTNWRSPLELRHKVVSEIDPELLFTIEQRMKGDQWHNGKYTIIPKVSLNQGLNFIDRSALDYLQTLKEYLKEKNHQPNKPLAFLCNPPYRSDDDQSANSVTYNVHPSIMEITGKDACSERYCCFLAQMKLICQAAPENDIPEESILLLFTKAAWLTKRPIFSQIRAEICGAFEDIGGVIVDSKQFFDVKARFPVAFTMWKYKGSATCLSKNRSIALTDLTWVTKDQLSSIQWDNVSSTDMVCDGILRDQRSVKIQIGRDETKIRDWVGVSMLDFKRGRRKSETNESHTGGLPANDPRRKNKKTYGDPGGKHIGFMDDLTPCRIKTPSTGRPWFRLNSQFMDCRKTRCLSGPPDHVGYCASDEELTEKMFLWFAMGRTFAYCGYPLWVDAMEMWRPVIPSSLHQEIGDLTFAIGFADNECIDASFPANNPISGAPEIVANNPMSPLYKDSFWCKSMLPKCNGSFKESKELINAVTEFYNGWEQVLNGRRELFVDYHRPYFVAPGALVLNSGIVQIKDYAIEKGVTNLLSGWRTVQEKSKVAKERLYQMLADKDSVNYFSQIETRLNILPFVPKTKFDFILAKRLAIASLLVEKFHNDSNFGRTKFVKLFFLLDCLYQLDLKTEYRREAAGPLDARALYNHKVGIEPLAKTYNYFVTVHDGSGFVRYIPGENIALATNYAKEFLSGVDVDDLFKVMKPLDTTRCEIIATLFACWNDLLIQGVFVSDDVIIKEFLLNWHERKTRFPKSTLLRELGMMKENGIVPAGKGKTTLPTAPSGAG